MFTTTLVATTTVLLFNSCLSLFYAHNIHTPFKSFDILLYPQVSAYIWHKLIFFVGLHFHLKGLGFLDKKYISVNLNAI